jgi:hypothetical protein
MLTSIGFQTFSANGSKPQVDAQLQFDLGEKNWFGFGWADE